MTRSARVTRTCRCWCVAVEVGWLPWNRRSRGRVVQVMDSHPPMTGGQHSAVSVRLVGGPTAVVEVAGLRLLTDPTFSPPGLHESAPGRPLTKTEGPALTAGEIGPIDVVLLSHDQHTDNLDPAGRDVVAAAPLTLTTASAASRLGGTARPLPAWQQVQLPGPGGATIQITAVPARHGPPGCEPVTGEVTGFVVHGDRLPIIYISGDNASLDLVADLAACIGPVEIALLFAGAARTTLFDGAPLTLTSADAARAGGLLRARWIVPLHIRGWAHFSEGPATIDTAFADAGMNNRLRLLTPGQITTLT
jgi:L-ascorbate metabolism protein UlaG (beta-lactamase superfamily)